MAAKDVGVRIRVEKRLRDAFQAACTAEVRQASDVLREFMEHFAARHMNGRQATLFVTEKQLQRTYTKTQTIEDAHAKH